jgi:regulatory protein
MKTPPDGPQPTLRGRAIRLLARREHSRAELAKKLAAFGSTEEINNVLDQLEQNGLLSDARAAAAYVRGHAARFGTARLSQSLRTKGISSELIEASLAQEVILDEQQRASAIWRRKFPAKPHDAREWARQARFLQSRGFATEIIRKLLKAPEGEDE